MSRNILITGSGKGLAYEVTKKHLELGDTVYALEYRLTDALAALDAQYPSLTVKICDLGKTEDVADSLRDLTAKGQPLDILYNIAGIFFQHQEVSLEETDLELCTLQFNVNAMGPLRVMRYALPLIKDGTVVMNVTSEAGSVGDCVRPFSYGYSMSKAACNMAAKTFSNQLKNMGIQARVFCYHPGWMKTDMGGEGARKSPTSLTAEEAADRIMDITLQPDQIPADVMYLDYQKTPLAW